MGNLNVTFRPVARFSEDVTCIQAPVSGSGSTVQFYDMTFSLRNNCRPKSSLSTAVGPSD